MAATLDKSSWEKQKKKAKSLEKASVDKEMSNLFKSLSEVEKKGDPSIATKQMDKVKKCIVADKKALKGDKEGTKALDELEKQIDQKKKEVDGHFEIKSDTDTGLKSASGKGAKEKELPPGGGGGTADTIINGLKTGWDIFKSGEAVSSAQNAVCQAVPKEIKFSDLTGWQTGGTTWTVKATNLLGMDCVELNYKIDYKFGGTPSAAQGYFVTDFGCWADGKVLWGYSADSAAHVGKVWNSSKNKTVPIGAVGLLITCRYGNPAKKLTRNWKITVHGDGTRDVA